MVKLILAGVGLVCLFIYCSCVVYSAVISRLEGQLAGGRKLLAALSLIVGPVCLNWLLMIFSSAFPGNKPIVYYGFIVVLLVLSLPLVKSGMASFVGCFIPSFRRQLIVSGPKDLFCSLIVIVIFACLMSLFMAACLLPLYANDPLEYASVSRLIFNHMDPSLYPVVDAESSGGVYGAWTHPSGFIMFQVLAYLFQGSGDFFGLARLISQYYLWVLVLSFWVFARGQGRLYSLSVLVFILFTPLFINQVLINHIDLFRIATFYAGLMSVYVFLKAPGLVSASFSGLCFGACLYSHSLGMLAAPIVLALVLLFSRLSVGLRFFYAAYILAVGSIFIIYRFYINYTVVGAILGDTPEVWKIEALGVTEHVKAFRGLDGLWDVIWFGLLKGISKPTMFGVTYAISIGVGAALLLRLFFRLSREFNLSNLTFRFTRLNFTLVIVVSFYSMILTLTLLGSHQLIKNDRYLLTLHPFVAMLAAYGVYYLRGIWLRWRDKV